MVGVYSQTPNSSSNCNCSGLLIRDREVLQSILEDVVVHVHKERCQLGGEVRIVEQVGGEGNGWSRERALKVSGTFHDLFGWGPYFKRLIHHSFRVMLKDDSSILGSDKETKTICSKHQACFASKAIEVVV